MAVLTLTKVTLLNIKRMKYSEKKNQIDFKSTSNKHTYLFRHTILLFLSLSTKRFAFKSNFSSFFFLFFRFQFEINMSINKTEIDLPFLLFFVALHTLLSIFLTHSLIFYLLNLFLFIKKSLTFFYCF